MKRIADAAAVALIVVTIALAIYGLITLPDRIPVHFSPNGVSYGPKWTLLLWSMCAVGLYVALSFGMTRPVERMNLMVTVTPGNRARITALVQLMFSCLRAEAMLVFALITLVSIQSASGRLSPLLLLLMIASFGVVPILIGFMVAIVRAGGSPGVEGAPPSTGKL